ncbi:hypothetical protein AB0M23_23050 [Streptomyces sp. NPDC052077]|uniref:hypothetical protein n=1 Tax=Streptomyces sp. NPDC052077 TaxID=3154757 RepID=UPI003424A915
MRSWIKGLIAGAAGTVALNLTSYGDMLLRGRGSSEVPAQLVDAVADRVGLVLGDEESGPHREQAVGALSGMPPGSAWARPTGSCGGGAERCRTGWRGRCSARPPWRAATCRPPRSG